jgi:hypothetical protein
MIGTPVRCATRAAVEVGLERGVEAGVGAEGGERVVVGERVDGVALAAEHVAHDG